MKRLTTHVGVLLVIFEFSTLFMASCARAAVEGLSYSISPIVGLQRVVKYRPDVHAKTRLMYGALVVAGFRVLSGEAEVTRAQDDELYPLRDFQSKETEDRLKLGVRNITPLLGPFSLMVRAGGQAKRVTYEETTAKVTMIVKPKITYAPYLGAGLNLAITSGLQINAGVTAVVNDGADLSKVDYETTLGVTLGIL